MKVLALDTSTDACSVALFLDDAVSGLYELAARRHTELVLPMAERLLAEADVRLGDLDAIAFTRGPGAFTGLRIAAGVTQGMALGAELPVIAVSTLATMAQQVIETRDASAIAVALDARMDEVYWGCYVADAQGVACLEGQETVSAPAQVTIPESGEWFGAGSGWGVYEAQLRDAFGDRLRAVDASVMPDARYMHRLVRRAFESGALLAVEDAQPIYLRDQVADKPGQRK